MGILLESLNRCIVCGAIIPEGCQICPACMKTAEYIDQKRKDGKMSTGSFMAGIIDRDDMMKTGNDPVNHPSHYTSGKIECIDFITDKKLNFCRGNAVKYIVRAGLKDPAKEIEDLEKAIFYLNREIQDLRAKSDTE